MRLIFALIIIISAIPAYASFKGDLERALAKEHDLDYVVAKLYNGKGLAGNDNVEIVSIETKGNKFTSFIKSSLGKDLIVSGRFYNATLLPSFERNIGVGQIIHKEDIKFIKVADSRANNQYVSVAEDLVNKSARVNISKNKPIKKRDIINKVMITKGDNIKILFNKNNLSMEVLAQAQESGSIGDLIKVKNLDSNRSLHAKVLDSQTVRVGE